MEQAVLWLEKHLVEAYKERGFQTLVHQCNVEMPVLVPGYFPVIIHVLAGQAQTLQFAVTKLVHNIFMCAAAGSLPVKHGELLKSTQEDMIK